MTRLNLNGIWQMTGADFECEGMIPGSVYSFLLDNKLMEDPFYRMNELEAYKLMENEFEFSKTFEFMPTGDKVLLHCDGLDTLCDIYINGVHVAHTDNMHRTYEFDVTDLLQAGETEIIVPALSSVWLEEMDFGKTDVDHNYVSYEFRVNGEVMSEGTVLFTVPKYFDFIDPELSYEINGDEITVFTKSYASYVEIDSPDSDIVLSDNYFNINKGAKTVKILEGTPKTIRLRSVYDIQ